jgi:hypothetical protein
MSLTKVEKNVEMTSEDLTIRFADTLVTASGIVAALTVVEFIKSWFAVGGFLHRFAASGPGIAALITTLIAFGIGFWRVRLLPAAPPAEKKQEQKISTATINTLVNKKANNC